MNIEELGSSDPGGLASSIIDGVWVTLWIAVLIWVGKALYARWLVGKTAGEGERAASRDEDDQRPQW